DKEIGIEEHHDAVESRLGDADDGVGMFVDLSGAADHVAIILKASMPIPVAEHDVRSAVRAMFIGGVEETSDVGSNLEYVEVVSPDFLEPHAGWVITGIKCGLTCTVGRQTVETAVSITQIEVV